MFFFTSFFDGFSPEDRALIKSTGFFCFFEQVEEDVDDTVVVGVVVEPEPVGFCFKKVKLAPHEAQNVQEG